jgi:hypothetical protein
MNLTAAQFFGNKTLRRGRRLCAALSVFLLMAAPALAEPVRIHQVQTVTTSPGTIDLRLNTLVSQDPVAPGTGATPQTGPSKETTGSQGGTKTDSVLSGVTVSSQGQQLGVEIVEEGEVEGTVCDCGEILIAGGGFPKWPLLFLAAVPLVFINDCDTCDDNPISTPTPPTSVSTPTPPPTPTPEPATLLLFGTGLLAAGAGLRRRYTKSRLVEQSNAREEE